MINLDGKVNAIALRALESHTLLDYLRGADIGALYCRPAFATWLTREYPGWTAEYRDQGPLPGGAPEHYYRRAPQASTRR